MVAPTPRAIRVGPYTFEGLVGEVIKDPVNIAFVGMEGGFGRVMDILDQLGFRFDWVVGNQYFAEPTRDGSRHLQDRNVATAPAGYNGRDHIRIYQLYRSTARSPQTIVGGVHRERWPRVGWFHWIRKPCDAVESFDAPREEIARRVRVWGFATESVDFLNTNPLRQCDRSWRRSDGKILVIREPGP